MRNQKKRSSDSLLDAIGIRELRLPQFGTGEVAEILGVPMWRLQKFLDSPRFQLASSETVGGKGHGSRRVFTKLDVYRIGLAARLIGDGFAPKFVASALEAIGDEELFGMDSENNVRPAGIVFRRAKKGPQIDFFKSGGSPPVTPETPEYYVLDLGALTREIDRRIAAVKSRS